MQDILDKIQEMKKELQQLEQRVNFSTDYKFLIYLFDEVFNIEEIEVKVEDIKENKTMYQIERSDEKIVLRRCK